MKTLTTVILIVSTILLTSAVWIVTIGIQNYDSQTNINAVNPAQTSIPQVATPAPTAIRFQTPNPTLNPPSPTQQPTPTQSSAIVTKPSIPEFTIQITDHSYNVPTTYTVDPYNGKTITHQGYHVENKTIDVIIKNQLFFPTTIDSNTTGLYYSVRMKGHYEDWTDKNTPYIYNYGTAIASTTTEATTFTYPQNFVPDDQIDFQVKALVGYYFAYYGGHIMPIGTVFHTIQDSGWSETQTLTIPKNTSTIP